MSRSPPEKSTPSNSPSKRTPRPGPSSSDTIYYTANKLLPAKQARQKKPHAIKLVGSGWVRNDKNATASPPSWHPSREKTASFPSPPRPRCSMPPSGPIQTGNSTLKESCHAARAATPPRSPTAPPRIHLEFCFDPSDDLNWTGQLYGNSGVFLMSGYELQVVNSYQNPTFADGHCGSIYGQQPPPRQRLPQAWQMAVLRHPLQGPLNSTITAPFWNPLRVTMYHNGILIHQDAWAYGEVGKPYKKHGPLPLKIQDHKGTGVSFRNLWIVPHVDYDQSLASFLGNFGNSPEHFVEATNKIEKPQVPKPQVGKDHHPARWNGARYGPQS